MVPLDCRVAVLLAMTTGGTEMGEVLRVTVFGRIALRCHCEPGRAWQSSQGRYVGCRGGAGVAGWFGWIAASGLCPSSQ